MKGPPQMVYPIVLRIETRLRRAIRDRIQRLADFVDLFRKREMTAQEMIDWTSANAPIRRRS